MTQEQWNDLLWRIDEFRWIAWFLFITWSIGAHTTFVRIKKDGT